MKSLSSHLQKVLFLHLGWMSVRMNAMWHPLCGFTCDRIWHVRLHHRTWHYSELLHFYCNGINTLRHSNACGNTRCIQNALLLSAPVFTHEAGKLVNFCVCFFVQVWGEMDRKLSVFCAKTYHLFGADVSVDNSSNWLQSSRPIFLILRLENSTRLLVWFRLLIN